MWFIGLCVCNLILQVFKANDSSSAYCWKLLTASATYLMFDIYRTNPIWFLMQHPSSTFQQYLISKIGWKLLKSPFWWDSRKENSGAQGGTHTAKPPVAGASAEVFSLGILRLFVDYGYFCIKLVLTQFAILEKGCKPQIAWQFKKALPPEEGVPSLLHSPWLIPTSVLLPPFCGHSCSHSSVLGGAGHGLRPWAFAVPVTQPGPWRNHANMWGL